GSYEVPILGGLVMDPRPMLRAIIDDVDAGAGIHLVAARFHRGIAEAPAVACERAAHEAGVETVVLSGGVFQNRLLLAWTSAALRALDLEVLVPERLPPNDGGISYGQAAIAAATMDGDAS